MTIFGISILFLACSEKSDDTAQDQTDSFAGMDFVLQSADGYEFTGSDISLSFSEDASQIGFYTGCNQYSSAYSVEDGILQADMFGGTLMACADEIMEQDDWMHDFLTAGPSIEHTGDLLILTGSDATLTYIDSEVATPDLPLEGSIWLIDSYIDGEIASAYNISESPNILFQDDGSVLVSTGCNDASGTYSVDANTISISVETMTDAVCEGDLQSIEEHILAVLNGTATYSIDADRLSIDNGNLGISAVAE